MVTAAPGSARPVTANGPSGSSAPLPGVSMIGAGGRTRMAIVTFELSALPAPDSELADWLTVSVCVPEPAIATATENAPVFPSSVPSPSLVPPW